MKPLIGITADVANTDTQLLKNAYVQAIIQAGGIPIILPACNDEDIPQLLSNLSGLLLSGGNDLNPLLFNEEPHRSLGEVTPSRDVFELALVQRALELDMPILAICRGIQVLSIVCGGEVYQDIVQQHEGTSHQHHQNAPRKHPSHSVSVEKGSLLHTIVNHHKLIVNSFHHQSVKKLPPGFRLASIATDGIIEAIESCEHQFVLGVQWHPEELAIHDDKDSIKLFDHFIKKCRS